MTSALSEHQVRDHVKRCLDKLRHKRCRDKLRHKRAASAAKTTDSQCVATKDNGERCRIFRGGDKGQPFNADGFCNFHQGKRFVDRYLEQQQPEQPSLAVAAQCKSPIRLTSRRYLATNEISCHHGPSNRADNADAEDGYWDDAMLAAAAAIELAHLQSKRPLSSILLLPVQLLFELLPLRSRLACLCVSVAWHRSWSQPKLWQRVTMPVEGRTLLDLSQLSRAQLLAACRLAGGCLQELCFTGSDDIHSYLEPGGRRDQWNLTFQILADHPTVRVLRSRQCGWLTVADAREMLTVAQGLTCLEVAMLGGVGELNEGLAQLLKGPLHLVRLAVTVSAADSEDGCLLLFRALEDVGSLKELWIGGIGNVAVTTAVMRQVANVVNKCGLTKLRLWDRLYSQIPDEQVLATALLSNRTLKDLFIDVPSGCSDRVWLPTAQACTSLENLYASGAHHANWVVEMRRPGPQPFPDSFLGPCSPSLSDGTKVETQCWRVYCAAPGCRQTVCTRHGHGVGDDTVDDGTHELHGCVEEGCHRQFCSEHAGSEHLWDCDVCANAVRFSRYVGAGGGTVELGRCKAHAPVRCTNFVGKCREVVEEEEDDDEMEEDEEELYHLATLHKVHRAATLTKKKLVKALIVAIKKLLHNDDPGTFLQGIVHRLIDKVSLSGLPRGICQALEAIGNGGNLCGFYCCPSCLENHTCGELQPGEEFSVKEDAAELLEQRVTAASGISITRLVAA